MPVLTSPLLERSAPDVGPVKLWRRLTLRSHRPASVSGGGMRGIAAYYLIALGGHENPGHVMFCIPNIFSPAGCMGLPRPGATV